MKPAPWYLVFGAHAEQDLPRLPHPQCTACTRADVHGWQIDDGNWFLTPVERTYTRMQFGHGAYFGTVCGWVDLATCTEEQALEQAEARQIFRLESQDQPYRQQQQLLTLSEDPLICTYDLDTTQPGQQMVQADDAPGDLPPRRHGLCVVPGDRGRG